MGGWVVECRDETERRRVKASARPETVLRIMGGKERGSGQNRAEQSRALGGRGWQERRRVLGTVSHCWWVGVRGLRLNSGRAVGECRR